MLTSSPVLSMRICFIGTPVVFEGVVFETYKMFDIKSEEFELTMNCGQ